MSTIADFRIIDTHKLNELHQNVGIKIEKKLFVNKRTDTYWEYLNVNSNKLNDFSYSGHILANLLIFLAEHKGIDLLTGRYDDIANSISEKRRNSTFILTYEQHQSYLDKLMFHKFEELAAFNKDFSDEDNPELVDAEIEGIEALRESLEQLASSDQLILSSVG
jgi:hypothetical protein